MKGLPLLRLYVITVAAVGIPLGGLLTYEMVRTKPDIPWFLVSLLLLGLVLGEVLPVQIGRGRKASIISFSMGFGFGLMLVAPLAIALLSQALINVVHDVRRRAGWMRLSFNLGVDIISVSLARVAFHAVTGQHALSQDVLRGAEVVGIMAAVLTHLVVSHLLVSTVLALASSQPLWRTLTDHLGPRLLPYGMMGLAPVSIPVLHYSPWLFPLLVTPVALLHYSSKLTIRREHEALHDPLTGLPNRALLKQNFEDALHAMGSEDGELALMLVDLDHFKQINDTLGHHVGDMLLCDVAQKLRGAVRETDTVARLGGDEFAIIVSAPVGEGEAEARLVADRLLRALRQPLMVQDVRIDAQGSVGIALAPDHGTDLTLLMNRADLALYAAKENRNVAAVYQARQDEQTPEHLLLLGQLRAAIEEDALELHYAPQMDIATGAVVGVEALVRWRHTERGLLQSEQFLAMAESTGLILPMTLKVLDAALAQNRTWLERGWRLRTAVNLSARHLTDHEFPTQISELLARHGVPAGLLTLQVTEDMLMSDRARSATVLRRIRQQGVAVAVSGYGTGHCGPAHLRALDIDELKIDSNLIASLLNSRTDALIVNSTIELAHSLGFRVVAQGVQDGLTLSRLAEWGCDMAEGAFSQAPAAADALENWLATRALGAPNGAASLHL